jgi:hypothetical protein
MQEAILQGEAIDTKPDDWIRAKEQFSPADQLAVYMNAYRYRLYDVTAEDYPVLKYHLGADAFHQLITDFVNTVHSEHFNVGRYAAHLPDFLARTAGDAFVQELAVLENAISQLHDSKETIPLEPAHLAEITADSLMEFILSPRAALQLFAFAYPVNDYYIAVKNEKMPQPPVPVKIFLAVFRHDDVVWRMELAENEYHLLHKLFGGTPIGEALNTLQTELVLPEDELSNQLSTWFSRWMRNGLLAHHEYKNETSIRSIA